MAAVNPELRLYQDTYTEEKYSSENHLINAMLMDSDILSPMVTHLYGSDKNFGSKNFPLTFISEGMGNVESMRTTQFQLPVMGRPKKASKVATTIHSGADEPGKGRTTFEIPFVDRLFRKGQVLISGKNRIRVRVSENPRKQGEAWYYTVQLLNPNESAFCPVEDLAAMSKWTGSAVVVGKSRSRGTDNSPSYGPSRVTNQLSLVRDSYNYEGNVQNKVMNVEIKADGNTFNLWTEWELYLRNLEFKEACEVDLWMSEYNADSATGEVYIFDEDSGEPVFTSSGLLEQIPNSDNYAYLTGRKIEQIITDVFSNASDATAVDVEVFTGIGGLREADKAMKQVSSGFEALGDRLVQGEGYNMAYGAYFNVYRHIDGHKVTFRHLPMMDDGRMSDASEPHPKTGLPQFSYHMFFVDNSVYDGQRNIIYLSEMGRENIQFLVPGATVPKGYEETIYRASDVDSSSIHWMKSQGIHVRRPTNCFKLWNTIS